MEANSLFLINGIIPGTDLKIIKVILILIVMSLSAGCARNAEEIQLSPRITLEPTPIPLADVEFAGKLVTFGKLRTVIQSRELIIFEDGSTKQIQEIRPILEKDLVDRDFRIFSGTVEPEATIGEISRRLKPHLVIRFDAESKFVDSTGRFSKFRGRAEAKVARGYDGSILVTEIIENMGPRQQDPERAGELALRDLAPELSRRIIDGLLAKTDQLLWAGLIIDDLPSMEEAVRIQNMIEEQPFVGYVELLKWDQESEMAVYEIIYGLEHESDIASLLSNITGLEVEISRYDPGSMKILFEDMERY